MTDQDLSTLFWNIQSPGELCAISGLDNVNKHLVEFPVFDLYAFCGIRDEDCAERLRNHIAQHANADYEQVVGTTGYGNDLLAIFYNSTVLSPAGKHLELKAIREGNGRAPLVASLMHQTDGTRFSFMLNHLESSVVETRLKQSTMLNQWVADNAGPVIMMGDFNYFDVRTDNHPEDDQGFARLTADGVLKWVKPDTLVPTEFAADLEIDWILDLVFVGNGARQWNSKSKILLSKHPRAYFLQDSVPDHRPVAAAFAWSNGE